MPSRRRHLARTIFRELFPLGLSALDDQKYFSPDLVPTLSHMVARQEMRALIAMLKLPIDKNGRRRAEARMQWMRPDRAKIGDLKIFVD